MKRSKGQRQGTRSILRRGRHDRGRVNISRIMHDYAEGDRVAIVLDGGHLYIEGCSAAVKTVAAATV